MEDKPNISVVENLLNALSNFFRDKAIVVKSRAKTKDNAAENTKNSQWIKDFIIQPSESAFYLRINSPEDIQTLNAELNSALKSTQDSLKRFLKNNSELEETLKRKVTSFIGHLEKAMIQVTKGRLKKELKNVGETCNDVDEMIEKAGKLYAKFIKDDILEQIMYPSYEGLRHNPNETVYFSVVKEINQFLANLGVMTIQIDEGDVWQDDSQYNTSEESKADEYKTNDENQKDIVRAVLRYAYAFQENKGEDNLQIADGEVIVMVYKPEGV